jgi:mono/diheme cytochrome c family protein
MKAFRSFLNATLKAGQVPAEVPGILKMRFIPIALLFAFAANGHDIITTKVTFDREIIRLFNAHCISCHREGGQAFSLATYQDARPWAKAIGAEVLERSMPPWGAVKGFGDFRDDQALTPEQLELIVDWEEGGAPEGEPKDLPPPLTESTHPGLARPADQVAISGDIKLAHALKLGALWPEKVPEGASFQITAELPDGTIYPLIWLHKYTMKFNHPFLLRVPLELPAATVVRGVPSGANIGLIPVADVPPPKYQGVRVSKNNSPPK